MKKSFCCFLLVLVIVFTNIAPAFAADQKYGSYNKKNFYYTISGTKNVRVEKRVQSVNKSDEIKALAKGAVNLACCFLNLDLALTVPQSLFSSAISGNPSATITTKSYSLYVCQFTYKTRDIYAYSNDSKKTGKRTVLTDESGRADIFYEFHPVGTGFKQSTYSTKLASNKAVATVNYNSKTANLKSAYSSFTHKGCGVWRLQNLTLSESFVKQ